MKLSELKTLVESEGNALADILNTNCAKNVQQIISGNAPILWRGVDATSQGNVTVTTQSNRKFDVKFSVVPRRTTSRNSQSFSLLVMKWIDSHSAWGDFPKRGLSNICSTSYDVAEEFGPANVVIPFDNVQAYGMSREDINTTDLGKINVMRVGIEFSKANRHLNSIFDQLVDWRLKVDTTDEVHAIDDAITAISAYVKFAGRGENLLADISSHAHLEKLFELFYTAMRAILKIASSESMNDRVRFDVLRNLNDADMAFNTTSGIRFDKPLYPQLTELLSPERLRARSVDNLSMVRPSYDEVWFEGDCVLLRSPAFKADFTSEIRFDLAEIIGKPIQKSGKKVWRRIFPLNAS